MTLGLEGECGFGRKCVGVLAEVYPDYEWYDDNYERIDNNGKVWTPEDAYHKHPCVAVLGRGEEAEAQLFDWLQWFDTNGFKVETGKNELPDDPQLARLYTLMGKKGTYARMVRTPIGGTQNADTTSTGKSD